MTNKLHLVPFVAVAHALTDHGGAAATRVASISVSVRLPGGSLKKLPASAYAEGGRLFRERVRVRN